MVTFQSIPEIQYGDIPVDEAASCVTESHGVKAKLKASVSGVSVSGCIDKMVSI